MTKTYHKTSIDKPSLTQPLKFISTSNAANAGPSGLSSFKKSNKKCHKKCHRGPLPWEKDKEPEPCKGILPFRKSVKDYVELDKTKYTAVCRYCYPTYCGKASPRKKKRKRQTCKPFHDQDLIAKKKSECEKRRITKCMKKACNPEIECVNLGPVCKKANKVYPMSYSIPKPIPGCPTPGWKTLRKKALSECKDQ